MTVYTYFNKWSKDGVWQQLHDALVVRARKSLDRKAMPSVLIVDSQTVRTPEKGGLAATIVRRR